eukprot:s2105_g8.t1
MAAATPNAFLEKARELIAKKEEEAKQEPGQLLQPKEESANAPSKRWCSAFQKQLAGVSGDLSLEMMEYLSYWQRDPAELSSLSLQEHPALIVPQYLASPNTEHNNLNAEAIEQWMSEYAAKRGLSAIYKKTEDFVWSPDTALEFACPSSFLTEMFSCVQILDSSISGDTLKFAVPADGMPAIRDWLAVFESMICTGVDVQREPLSVNAS